MYWKIFIFHSLLFCHSNSQIGTQFFAHSLRFARRWKALYEWQWICLFINSCNYDGFCKYQSSLVIDICWILYIHVWDEDDEVLWEYWIFQESWFPEKTNQKYIMSSIVFHRNGLGHRYIFNKSISVARQYYLYLLAIHRSCIGKLPYVWRDKVLLWGRYSKYAATNVLLFGKQRSIILFSKEVVLYFYELNCHFGITTY